MLTSYYNLYNLIFGETPGGVGNGRAGSF